MLNSLLGHHGKYTYPRPLVYAKRFVEVLATPHRHHATQAYTTNSEIDCSSLAQSIGLSRWTDVALPNTGRCF